MAIPALFVGAGVVAVMWGASRKPQAAHTLGSAGAAAQAHQAGTQKGATTVPDGANDPAVEMDADPAQPSVTITNQATPEGATDTSSSQSQPSGTTASPNTAPAMAQAGPAVATAAPAPAPMFAQTSAQALYHATYGTDATKAQQSTFYAGQAAAGQIVY